MNSQTKTKIAHSCTFCGGPVAMENDEIIAPCNNCGAMLRLMPPQGLETFLIDGRMGLREAIFFLERDLKEQEKSLIRGRGEMFQVYLPFYYVNGKIFEFRKRNIEHKRCSDDGQEYTYKTEQQESSLKKKEISLAAFKDLRFGIESLGVRTSTMQLVPLVPSRATDKTFVKTTFDINYALKRYDSTTRNASSYLGDNSSKRFSRALRPHLSVIYFPLWVINFSNDEGVFFAIIDCVAKRVIKIENEELPCDTIDKENVEGQIFKMIAHRCDYCGFDLPRQKNGEVFICSNCGKAYKSEGEKYARQIYEIPREKYRGSSMFPFWLIHLDQSEGNERIKSALNIESDTIYIPAFEITNLKRAARLSLSLSRAIDEYDFDKLEESDYQFIPANLTADDAKSIILPLLMAGRDHLECLDLDSLWTVFMDFSETRMVWLPFIEEGYFYRGQLTGQGFEKAALAL